MTRDKKSQRKEKVLHTRVSEELDEELRERAAGLGVSVSNLVRNILLNTVEMVEDIVADGSSIARAASKSKAAPEPAPAPPATGEILGWQELQLNLNAICEACNEILPKGSRAALAVRDGQGPRLFRCLACLPGATSAEAMTNADTDKDGDSQ